jgi:uncharacterized membrane protein AbrB (regulator of aidB expression)
MVELAGILLLLGGLAALLLLIAAPIILVFMVVGVVLRTVFFLITLPFRLLGWGLGIGFSLFGLLLKGAVLAALVALLVLIGALPFVPVLLVGGLIYLLLRASRKRASPVTAPPGS